MSSTYKSILINNWKGKVPSKQLHIISRRMEGLSDYDLDKLVLLDLKSPTVTLLLSLFVGCLGIDRFYLSQVGLGILKLLFSWMTFGIWWLLDIYFSYQKAKQINADRILQALGFII